MSRELAVIHARENIRVNALSPGPLRTELLMKFLNTEAKKQRRLVHVPMGRFGEAKEMVGRTPRGRSGVWLLPKSIQNNPDRERRLCPESKKNLR